MMSTSKHSEYQARRGILVAQRVVVEMTDDIDGKPAAETVSFGLDGRTFEIDLSEKNAKSLRKELAPWVASARRVSGRRPAGAARRVQRQGEPRCGPEGGPGVGGEQRVRRLAARPDLRRDHGEVPGRGQLTRRTCRQADVARGRVQNVGHAAVVRHAGDCFVLDLVVKPRFITFKARVLRGRHG